MNKKQLRKKLALMLANLKKKRPFYTEVEYLESTGTQYIDTGYKMVAGKTMTFNGNIMWTQSNGTANFFYGYRSVNSATAEGDMRAFFIYGASPAGRLAIRYGKNVDNSNSYLSLNQMYNLSFDGTILKVNGNFYVNLTGAYETPIYKSMWLFNCNCTGYYSSDVSTFSGRIYNWQIFEDGELVRDMIPVLDWNMKPCMYDRVTEQLFYNKGTGDFVAGREIHPVEYLESTGTQYIDTGYKPNNNTKISMSFLHTSLDSTYRSPLSIRTADGSDDQFTATASTNSATTTGFGRGVYFNIIPSFSANTKYDILFYDRHIEVNGVIRGNTTWAITPSNLTAYMFARNANGTASNFFIGRIYDCQLKENGTLVRDYIPAIDSEGRGFMFDRVSHTCFLNQGTGSFVPASYQLDGNGRVVEPEYE